MTHGIDVRIFGLCRLSRRCGEAIYIDMLKPSPTPTNTARQKKFRESNPGYYARMQRRRRAAEKPLRVVLTPEVVPVEIMLALPTPVVLIEIPGMTTIAVKQEHHEQIERS